MKYNPGDKVKIKSLDWYNENKISEISKFMKDQGIRSYVDCNGFRFLDVMCEYCGKVLTVDFISECADGSKSYIMREPAIGFGFTDDMIEGLADELQGRMVSLDDVCKFLDEHLYTNTSDGDYDFGQEYICSDFDNATDLICALRKKFEE